MLEVLLLVVGLAVGFGANTVITKQQIGSAADQATKELDKAKREARKRSLLSSLVSFFLNNNGKSEG